MRATDTLPTPTAMLRRAAAALVAGALLAGAASAQESGLVEPIREGGPQRPIGPIQSIDPIQRAAPRLPGQSLDAAAAADARELDRAAPRRGRHARLTVSPRAASAAPAERPTRRVLRVEREADTPRSVRRVPSSSRGSPPRR